MRKANRIVRATALVVLWCFAVTIILPVVPFAQAPDCQYDRANPQLDHARIAFKSLNYKCAEQEIEDVLKREDLSIQDKADAHILLAAVYYAMLKDDTVKREKIIEQFKAAFTAYRNWRGELDISSTEFIDLMREAQKQVDKEALAKVTEEKKSADSTAAAVQAAPAKAKKAWYKQWWALGLGVGVVAGSVALMAGGGSKSEPAQPLPGFPDHP
jgi:hypothetical protein